MPASDFTHQAVDVEPPLGVHLPSVDDILSDICAADTFRAGFAYPPNAPVCWIKYGRSLYWNEVLAQVTAYHELRELRSLVRAPGVFYAFQIYPFTYIVMEYIPGKTAGQCLAEAQDEASKEAIYRSIALALSELHRIPIPAASRPAAVCGGRIRHTIFDQLRAPRHYEDVQQLEDHFNEFLKVTKRKPLIRDLAREPLVFCQSDLFPENFILDSVDKSRVIAIDFSDASIVPSSFVKYALLDHRLGFDISEWVYVPSTEGVDNTMALCVVAGRIVMGSHSFAMAGKRMPGGDRETQDRITKSLERPQSESGSEDTDEVRPSQNPIVAS